MKEIILPKSKYRGYVWMSNQVCPTQFFDQEEEFVFSHFDLPFVVEAMLIDLQANKSYMIKSNNGQLFVKQSDLLSLQNIEKYSKSVSFKALPQTGFSEIIMAHRWSYSQDQYCQNMETFFPEDLILVDLK